MIAPYPWQTSQWQYLVDLVKIDRLPHALLFTGNECVGKYHLAQCLQFYLLCQAAHKPCGKCQACHWLQGGNHPDAYTLAPDENTNIITIGAVRQWMEGFQQSTHVGQGYQVTIINAAHTLNIAAANSLLKILEEPPTKRLIILVTHTPGDLLPTIKSRCQRVNFTVNNPSLVKDWLLATTHGVSAETLNLAEGAPLKMLAYINNDEIAFRKELIEGLLAIQSSTQSPVILAEKWETFLPQRLMEGLQFVIEDILRLKADHNATLYHENLRHQLIFLTKNLSWQRLFKLIDYFFPQFAFHKKLTGLNNQLLWEDFLIQWSGEIPHHLLLK